MQVCLNAAQKTHPTVVDESIGKLSGFYIAVFHNTWTFLI